jgi:hypothetical protein
VIWWLFKIVKFNSRIFFNDYLHLDDLYTSIPNDIKTLILNVYPMFNMRILDSLIVLFEKGILMKLTLNLMDIVGC